MYFSLVHVTDWLPTLISAAGGDPPTLIPSPIDGVDLWQALTAAGPSPRTEMLYNIFPREETTNGLGAALRQVIYVVLKMNSD